MDRARPKGFPRQCRAHHLLPCAAGAAAQGRRSTTRSSSAASRALARIPYSKPAKQAVAPWNWREISPQALLGQFNGFTRSVVLRVNEACDLGELNRYQFYEHMKPYTAAPPDVLRVNEKFLRDYDVLNCTGVIITTNHKTDGMYLPAGDRRHYVAWSEAKQADFPESYWRKMWHWYREESGFEHVAAYLAGLDLSGFRSQRSRRLRQKPFGLIANAHRAPEDAELADVLELLRHPDGCDDRAGSRASAAGDFALWIGDRKNRRNIPHRLESCGYVPVRNPDHQGRPVED